MLYKDMTGKQIVGVGQISLVLGLGCNATSIILNHFTNVSDFLLGFLIGIGCISIGTSIVFNIYGIKLNRSDS